MENYGEVGVPEFTLLMRDFLEDRLDASQYAKQYFALMEADDSDRRRVTGSATRLW